MNSRYTGADIAQSQFYQLPKFLMQGVGKGVFEIMAPDNNAENNAGLAVYLGTSTQALSNKLYRDSFSAADLIKVATFLGVELAFIVDERQRVTLETADIEMRSKEDGEGTENGT